MSGFTIEVTTTDACNFDCEYCFEREFEPKLSILDKNYELLTLRMNELMNSDWLKSIADTIQITFWGGEPSLNLTMIKNIVRDFKNDERVSFFIYTNGSKIKELMPTLLSVKPRFRVQVSYDGMPIHDMRRKTRGGHVTSKNVKESLHLLEKNGIPFGIKSTVMHKDFKYIPEAWDDIYELDKQFNTNLRYALTVDYHNLKVNEYFNEIENALIKVAGRERKFFKDNERFLSNIFSANKRICQTDRMVTFDTKGRVYFCHGSIYSTCSDELYFTDMFQDNFAKTVEENFKRFNEKKGIPVEECVECIALSCLRCNVKKFENSSKDKLVDRWYDYPCQKELCSYYKLIGKIGRALVDIIKED
jgi:sulfatase maturation enzyme AslB (radical SAM superfamily)